MTIQKHFLSILVTLGLVMLVTGCGKTSSLAGLVPATGVICCDGVPLEGAIISFYPSLENGRTAISQSNSEGKFTLTTLNTNDGAFPDDYKIAVTVLPLENSAQVSLPQKYLNPATSGLFLTLSGKGDKNIRLELSTRN